MLRHLSVADDINSSDLAATALALGAPSDRGLDSECHRVDARGRRRWRSACVATAEVGFMVTLGRVAAHSRR